jgi:hypothetical protein
LACREAHPHAELVSHTHRVSRSFVDLSRATARFSGAIQHRTSTEEWVLERPSPQVKPVQEDELEKIALAQPTSNPFGAATAGKPLDPLHSATWTAIDLQ